MNRKIRGSSGVFVGFLFLQRLKGVARFDEGVELLLQAGKRKLKTSSQGGNKKILPQQPVKALAALPAARAGVAKREMLDVRLA